MQVYSRGTVARLGLITSIHYTFNKLALSEQWHSGIVCTSAGGHSKANGGWQHLWPRPSSCQPPPPAPHTPSSQVMLRKCQPEKKGKQKTKEKKNPVRFVRAWSWAELSAVRLWHPALLWTWHQTVVVTHGGSDSTQLSDLHYATVTRLWARRRDERCDRAPPPVGSRVSGERGANFWTQARWIFGSENMISPPTPNFCLFIHCH